jgi:hypothetical protein
LLRLWLLNAQELTPRAPRLVREGDSLTLSTAEGAAEKINLDPGAREQKLRGPDLSDKLEQDLREIVEYCKARDVPVILQTYASRQNEIFHRANAAARVVSGSAHVSLVDHADHFQTSNILHAFQPDGHPTGLGYEVMAKNLDRYLRTDAAFRGWDFPEEWRPNGAISTPIPVVDISPRALVPGQPVRLDLSGPPGGRWFLGLSPVLLDSPGPGRLSIDPAGEMFNRAFRGEVGLHGTFEEDGTGFAEIYPSFYDSFEEDTAYGQLFLWDEKLLDDPVPVSDVVELKWR